MEKSTLYDALYDAYFSDFRAELEKEQNDYPTKCVQDAREAIEKKLSAEDLKLVDDFIFNFSLREDFINRQAGIKILNYGVKLGMELEEAFKEIDEEE